MKSGRIIILSPMLALSLLSPLRGEGKAATGIEGNWLGTLSTGGGELRIVFRVAKNPDSAWKVLLDSPDQGAEGIPTSAVSFDQDHLRVESQAVAGIFEGDFSPEKDEISGVWKQGGMELPLVLKRTEKIVPRQRPQEPRKPYPYLEEEVVYENRAAGIRLAGTLTLPQGPGPYPAAILITGSGAEDRNETVFGHRPFLVLADALTRRGIAVLRSDDRGIGGSTGSESQSTSADFALDVLTGVTFLKNRRDIDPGHIGLIGHSEGGLIAPLAAAREPAAVAFVVMLAGPGLPGDEILRLQGDLINRAGGDSEQVVAEKGEVQEKVLAVVKAEKDDAAAAAKLRAILAEAVVKMDPQTRKDFPPAAQEAQIKEVLSPWFRFFLSYDPRPTLMKVRCPVLALNGEKDLQVPPRENVRAVADALAAGGNRRVTVKVLAGLNHLFQTCQTGSPSEYVKIEETFAPAALQLIGDWILEQTRPQ